MAEKPKKQSNKPLTSTAANTSTDMCVHEQVGLADRKQQNQRRIAMISLYSVLCIISLLFIMALLAGTGQISALKDFSVVISAIALGLLGLVGAYMGLDSSAKKRI
jgi:hypothetical protein